MSTGIAFRLAIQRRALIDQPRGMVQHQQSTKEIKNNRQKQKEAVLAGLGLAWC
jgi:hypothetical protein